MGKRKMHSRRSIVTGTIRDLGIPLPGKPIAYDVFGKVALITGGGDGIGLAVARELHERGAVVALVDVNETALSAAVSSLGERVWTFVADVRDRDAMRSIVEQLVDRAGHLDVVVANAGITPPPATLRQSDPEDFDRVIDVNLIGVFNTVHPAIDHVIANKGHITVVSSAAAFAPPLGGASYMISKSGVEALGRALRLELAAFGATATVAYFGMVDTQLAKATLDDDEIGRKLDAKLPGPLRRRISPQRAATVIADGIARRAARTLAPAAWEAWAWTRGFVNILADGYLANDGSVRELIRELESRSHLPPPPTGVVMAEHLAESQSATTLCAAFQRVAAINPDAIALRTVGATQTLTWREYADQVRAIAAGFAGLGIGRGDTVALMMANRLDFYPVDVGAQHAGATSFSIYNTLPPASIKHVLTNAEAKVVVCEAQYVARIQDSGVALEKIVVVDAQPGEATAGTITLDNLIAAAPADFDFDAGWKSVRPDDIATLIYTSGTTGNPKGVESTHASLLFEANAVGKVLPIEYGDRITSFLPSAHIADRLTALYLQMVYGTQVTVVADPKLIGAAIPDCRPTIWGAVPRVWEKLKVGIELAVANEPDETRRQALQWAVGVGRRRIEALRAGEIVSRELEAQYAQADEKVLSALRKKLGLDEVKWAVSGAAPIPADTLAFFSALGVNISEIWGMSELTCIATVSTADPAKLGTVGKLLPGMEMKIADDGELLVRGPLVMKGYRGEPEKTAEAIDSDGWLSTGDIVTVDDDGYLTVIDRKKEMIINSSGKNMSPATIENAIKVESSLIGGVSTIGDGRPYNTALIALDTEAAANMAARKGTSCDAATLASDPDVVDQIIAAVARGNARLSRAEQIKRFVVLPTYWEPGGEELTPTMKLRRKPIAAKYATQIEQLYEDPIPGGVHEPVDSASAASAI